MEQLLRQRAESIWTAAIRSVLPDEAVRRALEHFHPQGRVFLVAAGKAAWQMAHAALAVLGRVDGGVVVTKYKHVRGEILGVNCYEAGHPVPDENSFAATEKALELVRGLAAQDTVKNIFGAFTIFTDKPFGIGDTINVNGFEGTVVDVGMRSTRIMGYDRRITSYPNYKITDASIVNISSEPMRRAMVKVGLTYDTGADKMNEALDILRGLPTKVKDVSENPSDITAYFSDYTDSALVITFYYYIEKQGDILKVTSDMNLAILAAFNKAGLNFAFPTRTLLVQRGGEDAGSGDESVPGNAPQTPNS
mgnify:CR=1 FL=1